jgi:hypothetical protein
MIPVDPTEPESREWLQTEDGSAWLDSDAGLRWLSGGSGEDWLGSRAGRAWTDGRQEERWQAYFSGAMREGPEWAITPAEAPRAGERVRFTSACRTMGGVEFETGELGIVVETSFTPIGVVTVTVRTPTVAVASSQ